VPVAPSLSRVRGVSRPPAARDCPPSARPHLTPDARPRAWHRDEIGFANQTWEQLPVSETNLTAELRAVQRVARQHPTGFITLEVDRVTMTSGGVLLLLLRPPAWKACEQPHEVDQLRANLSAAMPRGSAASNIMHVSLLRLLALPDAQYARRARAVRRVVESATAELAGYRFNTTKLLFVYERQCLTLNGTWNWVALGNDGANAGLGE
jgi:hypothetical protein